jgi:adenylosuccinate lyase
MHWILIGIGLIILRITEPMFGMFLSEISWFVFSGLFIYLGFALNSLQTAIRELQIRQRELLLELKRVTKSTHRAVQTLDYNLEYEPTPPEATTWLEENGAYEDFSSETIHTLNNEEWDKWLSDESGSTHKNYKEMPSTTPPLSSPI